MESWLLTILIFLPLLGIPQIVALSARDAAKARYVALVASLATFGVACYVIVLYALHAWGTGNFALEQSLSLMSLGGAGPAAHRPSRRCITSASTASVCGWSP